MRSRFLNVVRCTSGQRKYSDGGSVMLEVAASIGPFLFIIYLFCSLGVHLYHRVGLQFAVNQTARWASIGDVQFVDANRTKVQNISGLTLANIRTRLKNQAIFYGISLTDNEIQVQRVCGVGEPVASCTVSSLNKNGCTNDEITAGTCSPGANQIFRLSASRTERIMFGFVTLPLNADAVSISEL